MNEFSMEENIEMARAFVQEELVSRGMIADFAIHDPVRPKGAEPKHYTFTCQNISLENEFFINEFWNFLMRM